MLMRPVRSRRLTLLAAGTLLASPLLTGCGFDYQTDQINTISAGVNDRTGDIDVLGGVVIAGEDDLGLFVGNLVNTTTEDATFEGLQPTEDLEAIETESIEVPAGGQANLFDEGGIPVTGSFQAGDFVTVTVSFDTGQVTTFEVNVVTPCRQYSLDKLTELTLPTSATGTTEDESVPESEASEDAASEEEGEPGPYSCEPATPVEHGGGEEQESGPGEVAPSPEGETEE